MSPADDFGHVVAHLTARGRRWLRSALERSHPGHPWYDRLER